MFIMKRDEEWRGVGMYVLSILNSCTIRVLFNGIIIGECKGS